MKTWALGPTPGQQVKPANRISIFSENGKQAWTSLFKSESADIRFGLFYLFWIDIYHFEVYMNNRYRLPSRNYHGNTFSLGGVVCGQYHDNH